MNSPVDMTSWEDEALLERARRRGGSDDRPFAILFERHQRLVWSICYRFTSSTVDAEDLLQEVFIKAYQNLASFEGRSTFRTWLYQIALNTCRNELRFRKRRPRPLDAHVEDLELADASSNPAAAPDPEFEAVTTALLKLRSDEREILIMRDIDELPFADIAQELGIQVSAAKMRVQRARLALVGALKAEQRDE